MTPDINDLNKRVVNLERLVVGLLVMLEESELSRLSKSGTDTTNIETSYARMSREFFDAAFDIPGSNFCNMKSQFVTNREYIPVNTLLNDVIKENEDGD